MRDRWRSPHIQDGALALALTGWNQWELAELAEFTEGAIALNHVTFAVMTLAVALRRSAPLGCATMASAGLTVQTIWGGEVFGASAQFVALLVAMHAAGSHPVRTRAWAGLAVMMIGVESFPFVTDEELVIADEVGNTAVFVALWALARAVQVGREKRIALALAQERREREAVEAERARVARELHDIVAHGLSLMVLHAGAARSATNPGDVGRSLAVVEDSGRAAMTELHRLLGMLAGTHAEQPDAMAGLGELEGLADQMRRAGMDVDLTIRPPEGVIDRSIELSAYRIVQESLTNTLRHSDSSRVQVQVHSEDGHLTVIVRDQGRNGTRPSPTIAGTGRGLRGLAERVELFGGEFTAGPCPSGWEVRATLPLGGRA